MTELSPQAIKIGLVYYQVCKKGEEVVNELHDRALALYDHAKEKAHSTIKDVNDGTEAQKKRATSFLQRNAYATVAATRSAIFEGCSSLVRVVPPFGSSRYDQ